MPDRRRLVPIARGAGLVLGGAAVAVQTMWMLLLGLAMSYGTPLGAPDSDWRGAAGVAMGSAAVLFGAGLAALGGPRRELAVVGTALGAAVYTGLYPFYPGLDADPWTWASLTFPWVVTGGTVALALRARRASAPPTAEPPTAADLAQRVPTG